MQFFCIDPKHSEQTKTPGVICSLWEFYGSKVFSRPVDAAVYKNKLTVKRRRYLARVLSSLTYRYVFFRAKCARAHRDVSVSYILPRLRRLENGLVN